jgi:hypothetical protein
VVGEVFHSPGGSLHFEQKGGEVRDSSVGVS